MLRIVIAPDSFKGSLSAPEVCAAIARGLVRSIPDVDVRPCPMADGGEGTLDAVLAAVGGAGRRRTMRVHGAGDALLDASFGLIEQPPRLTAIIEVAQIVGITDPQAMAVPVELRSSRGVGELIVALLDGGVRRFMVGLGGSSTNDGGSGLLAALGLRLVDAAGREVPGTPAGLAALARIDGAGLDPRLADAEFIIMSDVDNPLAGARGATAVFGPQKGVGADRIATFDASISRFAALAEATLHRHCAEKPGAGAAGGAGLRAPARRRNLFVRGGNRRRADRARCRAERRRLGDHRRRAQRHADAGLEGAVHRCPARGAARCAGYAALRSRRSGGVAGAEPPFRRLLWIAQRADDAGRLPARLGGAARQSCRTGRAAVRRRAQFAARRNRAANDLIVDAPVLASSPS